MTAPMLEVRALRKRFGRNEVLRGVELTVEPSEHLALAGNNGQGKTTLIRLVLGLLRPDSGEILLEGRLLGYPRPARDKLAVGYLPESVALYPNLTGRKTLHYFAALKGLGRRQKTSGEVERLLRRVGLQAAADQPVGRYSKGMRQRLGLAQALLGHPRLLLLDEPTNGLDPDGVHGFYDLLGELQRDGVAILMASHLLAEVEPRLDRLAVLSRGAIGTVGTLHELAHRSSLPSIIRFCLRDADTLMPESLAAHHPLAVRNGSERTFELAIAKSAKAKVLEALVHHAEQVETLVVRDPGLEELFRHILSGADEPTESPGVTAGDIAPGGLDR